MLNKGESHPALTCPKTLPEAKNDRLVMVQMRPKGAGGFLVFLFVLVLGLWLCFGGFLGFFKSYPTSCPW